MSEFSFNARSWDWELFGQPNNWADPITDDPRQAAMEQADREAAIKEKANVAAKEEENTRKRAEVLAALSTSGYSASGTNTARSFLTSL